MPNISSHDEEEDEENGGASTAHQLYIRVVGFKTQHDGGGGGGDYTAYYLQIQDETLGGKTFYIAKRFSQFYELHRELERLHPATLAVLPPPLRKTWFPCFEHDFLCARAREISAFVWAIAGSRALLSSPSVQRFFFSNLVSESDLDDGNLHAVDVMMSTPLMTPNRHGRWDLSEDMRSQFALQGLPFAARDMAEEEPALSSSSSRGKSWPFFSSCGCGSGEGEEARGGSGRHARTASLSSLPSVATTTTSLAEEEEETPPPPPPPASLRIVILLVGSRGDVQPYVALGKALQRAGHFVRIAAHECFREWVARDHGLDFMPIAGDPKELLAMVVENRMFSYAFVKRGVTTHRTWIYQVLLDCWAACVTPPGHASGSNRLNSAASDEFGPGKAFSRLPTQEFRADLVLGNPPSFAGWHIAEALGIPLVQTFPMPWTRTRAFPNPFTSLGATSSASVNWMSYGAVDRLIWLGMGDLVNKFRTEELLLAPIWTFSAKGHRYIHDYRVPCLYCWSPAVLAKPADWGKHVLVNGYMFLEDSDGEAWEPDESLQRCFADTPSRHRVVFIGFGSIVVKHPEQLSRTIEQVARILIQKHDCHVLVQKGWAGVELDASIPGLFQVGNAPHAWLFKRCAVLVHHGGAGTTSTGLSLGVPTVIVPFFGDQFFWGETVKRRGLGECQPYGPGLTVDRLVQCIETCLDNSSNGIRDKCARVAEQIQSENGVQRAVDFLHGIVWDTGVFDHASEEGWRVYPYFDLKQRVKLERREHPNTTYRKIKYRLNGLTRFQPRLMGVGGMEMNLVQHEGEEEEEEHGRFAFLPNLSASPPSSLPTRHSQVPQGHTDFSWNGTRAHLVPIPQGHTSFSWRG